MRKGGASLNRSDSRIICVCVYVCSFLFFFLFSLEVDITIQRGLVAVVFFATNLRISHLIIRSWMSLC